MRRFLLVFAVAALIASAVGYAVSDVFTTTAVAPKVTSERSIPVPQGLDQLESGGGELELLGCGNQGGGMAVVDPVSMTLHAATCSAFPPGERVAFSQTPLADIDALGSCKPQSVAVRATREIASGAAEPVGPVLLRFSGYCSTTHPSSAYTADSLWIYDCWAGPNNVPSGEVVRLSSTTGELEMSTPMAAVCHTSFSADRDGAFVGSYDDPGPIYFVPDGAHAARVVLRTAGRVNWFFGSGDSMFADIGAAGYSCAPVACGIWRFDGPAATPHLLLKDAQADDFVAAPVGGSSIGLFTLLQSPTVTHFNDFMFELVWISSKSGELRRLASLPPTSYAVTQSFAYVDGSVFLLANEALYRYSLS